MPERMLVTEGDDWRIVIAPSFDIAEEFVDWFEDECNRTYETTGSPQILNLVSNWSAASGPLLHAWALECGFNTIFGRACETFAGNSWPIWASLSYRL
jgi:hypothetical protein